MQYETYWQIDKVVDQLYAEKKHAEAIALLDQGAALFPDHIVDSQGYKLHILMEMEDHEAALTELEKGLEQDLFYAMSYGAFDPLRQLDRFKAIEEATARLKATAQSHSTMKYEVHTPPDYTPDHAYPLFLSLHGDGHNLKNHRELWPPDFLVEQGYIVVYVQSPIVISAQGFSWTENYATTRDTIATCYAAITDAYTIQTDQALIGGFSGGAIASIEIALSGVIQVRGFVAICPSIKPESCTPDHAVQAAQRGMRGVMMEGELMGEVPAEQEMLALFKSANLPCTFIVMDGIAHWYPPDLANKVNEAISFIVN